MPKRPCPFDEIDIPPQLKTYVGQKHVDNGVCREERMKEVYDKTMDLLKEGVKTLSRKLNESGNLLEEDILPPKDSLCSTSKTERGMKQMILTSKLGLEKMDNAQKSQFSKYDLCGCARVIDQCGANKCFYCDHLLCSSCLFPCSKCSEHFCQNCILPVYDNDEHTTCLNCFKHM